MLCQFTVKNFQCIKDELTLDMQATNITENAQSVLTDIDGAQFLPLAVIYGPNGSGKSTVLHALHSLQCKIMRPICAVSCDNKDCLKKSSEAIIKPFKFSRETQNAPTEFELFFRTDKFEYQYKLVVNRDKILGETLYKKLLTGSRYALVFRRKGTSLIELKGSLKTYQVTGISDNLPLLSFLGITHRRNLIIKDIIEWFDNTLDNLNYGNPVEDARIAITEASRVKSIILNMLAEMDIDIADYRIEDNQKDLKVFTCHSVDGKKYELELTEESNGTIKMFGMLPYIADSLTTGTTLVIDELDAKLHPVMLQYIISLFNDPSVNKKNAQLIFTSHDLMTMNGDNFRRDEIWFTAKGQDLATKMYSLVEFRDEEGRGVRKDERYDKRYLEGRYGADPYLRKIINWEEV